MAPPKRKRPHDEDELAAQPEKARRVTRQTSVPPPPLPVPPKPKPAPQHQRPLRANSTIVTNADGHTEAKLRRQRRTRRAAAEEALTEAVPEERAKKAPRTSAAKADKKDEPKTQQRRQLRDGKYLEEIGPAGGTGAAAKRAAKRAAQAAEIADSDASEEASEDNEEQEQEREKEKEKEKQHDKPKRGKKETSAKGEEAVPATRAGSPPARRSKRSTGAEVTATPVSPPQIPPIRHTITEIIPPSPPAPTPTALPKKETTIKPPLPPLPSSDASIPKPKKVTEVKPPPASAPAPSRPTRPTPIQPPQQPLPTPPAAAVLHQRHKTLQQQQQQNQALSSPRQPPPPQGIKTPKQPLTVGAAMAARSAVTPSLATSSTAPPPSSPSRPDRNIDKVVLGEICFRAWYPSYYGKEVLGDTTGNTHHGRGHASQSKGSGKENHQQHHHHHGHHGHRENPPMLDRLYVCPYCFKYSKEIVPWHGHVQVCETQFQIPGEKVYVHPKGVRTVRVPVAATPKGKRKRGTGEADVQYVEQVVRDEGEWSIWEVDGEKDVLFCQNLSLFAKLFLDNKSVFFDVTGFNYFLLVYTPPPSLPSSLRAAAAAATAAASPMGGHAGQTSILGAAPRPRVVGFFSKEKMSWDNNNLACILVFPPWQRKGLGALLMGVSYEISRREKVLGGPEKPISDLGKKGYKRFWAGEIARWLLSVDISAAAAGAASSSSLPSAGADGTIGLDDEQKSVVIDIADCSQATWIVREDCLLVLREMGVVEDAGMGPPKSHCENVLSQGELGGTDMTATDAGGLGPTPVPLPTAGAKASTATSAPPAAPTSAAGPSPSTLSADGASAGAAAAGAGDKQADPPRDVQRVRISKAAVRQWVKDHRISLDRACDPDGFIKQYTSKDTPQPEEA